MNVHVIVWESYGYEDNEYSTTIEVFNDLDSAQIYFETIKTDIIREYLEYTEYETIEGLVYDDYSFIDETPFPNGDQYFCVEYDEYGRDKLCIYAKPVMKFNTKEDV